MAASMASPAAAQGEDEGDTLEPIPDEGPAGDTYPEGEPFAPAPPAGDDGPRIDMPEDTTPAPAPAAGDHRRDVDPTRGLMEERFERAASTSVGGYGELHYNLVMPEEGDSEGTIDLHRLVLFFAHNFSEDIRFYSEVEIEHAFVLGGRASGEVGVEQAYVDWRLLGDRLGLRTGMVLVPMGIINQWHEPPTFHGVERPSVDRVIVPTTWREAGVGIFGEPMEGLRYELYLVSGLDPAGFSRNNGLRGGRQHVMNATLNSPAVTGRVEYEPMLGLVGGLSGYYGAAGPNADLGTNCTTDPVTGETTCLDDFDATVPVAGLSGDLRLRWQGIEARAMAAYFSVGDTQALRGAFPAVDVGSGLLGWYLEAGYDVLRLLGDTEHQLVPFVRLERYDTTFGHDDDAVEGSRAITDVVAGLSYRPVPQLVFKGDLVFRNPKTGNGATILDLGVGWMF